MNLSPSRKPQARARPTAPRPAPVVELSEAGLYVRMASGRRCARTVANGRWPHLAVDFDRRGRVIGIEAIPLPRRLSLNRLARQAGVRLPAGAIRRARLRLKFGTGDNF